MKFISLLSTLTLASAAAVPSTTEQGDQIHALTARSDDYPYSGKCDGGSYDPWRYPKCQCTSFIAWRLNNLGIKFNPDYKGSYWFNANSFDDAARKAGITVNKTPKVGSIAQTDVGQFGHVAWVTAVHGNQITVEDYNYGPGLTYGSRTMKTSDFENYIHIYN